MANALPMMNMGAVAGAGGTLGAAAGQGQMPAGLAGLFGLLVGTGEGAEGDLAGLGAALPFMPVKSIKTGAALPVPSVLPTAQSVTLADGVTLDLSGAQGDVSMIIAQLQAFTVKLTEAGVNLNNLGDVGELSTAFTKLGMDPAEAVAKAQSIHTMLEVIKSKLGIKDDTADGAMAMLIMAGLTGALPQVQGNVEVAVSVEQTTVTLVRVQAFNALNSAQARTPFGQDMARAIAGVGETLPEDGVPEVKSLKKPAGAHPADAKKTELTDMEDIALDADALDVADPIVPVAAAANAAAVAAPAAVETKAPLVVQSAPTVTAVAPEDVIDKPSGDVLFQWQEKDGADVVEKTPAHAKAFENLVDAARPEVAVVEIRHVGGNGQASVQGLIHVAEKITYTSTHDVVGQVKVQVQQVVDNNGGMVRMQLNPPELGEVRIELRIMNGEVSGKISATDATVVQELARDLQSLKQGFADSGLRLSQEGINLMLQNQNQQQQGGNRQQAGKQNRFVEDEGDVTAVDAAEVNTTRWVSPDRLLDVQI